MDVVQLCNVREAFRPNHGLRCFQMNPSVRHTIMTVVARYQMSSRASITTAVLTLLPCCPDRSCLMDIFL